ncbi:DUF6503 family protein [Nonlabens marinus]|uniref:Uncharacterized protein n=1 Tax=Nonlabens marinus S1-08 TaxID=1454201 RepID=W8VST7_9FLAO|nr:DUF6503 family protein [Nonlabens marinus]BAO56495.1 hypothetical protein NMS_2486 [Nonlabens marinus S1-08]
MKYISFLFIVFAFAKANSQQDSIQFTAKEIIEKSIDFHDPDNNWPTFDATFTIKMEMPEKADRISKIQINLPEEIFALTSTTVSESTSYYVNKYSVSMAKGGKIIEDVSDKDRDRAMTMKDYYTYLYGLPMKLNDTGTIVHDHVAKVWFWNINAYKVKVTYTQEVGSDVWYFYFDTDSFALEAYQFFKTDQNGEILQDSGEYILMNDLKVIEGIKIPAERNWYYNKNTLFLAKDLIVD